MHLDLYAALQGIKINVLLPTCCKTKEFDINIVLLHKKPKFMKEHSAICVRLFTVYEQSDLSYSLGPKDWMMLDLSQ